MQEKEKSTPFRIKLAGIVIEIAPLYGYIQEYCREYMVEGENAETANFTVAVTPRDIEFEREKSVRENEACAAFPDAYLETLAVYRKMAEKLLEYDIVLFHGSVIAVDGEGYLFTAKSGTGKSTHTRLWMEHFGERAVMINDDKPLLSITGQGVFAHGTPWSGKHNLNCNAAVPLKGICELTRAAENHIERISAREIYGKLLQQIYRPAGTEGMLKTMRLVDSLIKQVEFYRLGCNMEPEAAIVAYEGMCKQGGNP